MRARVGVWGSFGAILVVSLIVGMGAAQAHPSAATTWSLTFSEVGLPSGTSWTITFNSVAHSSTTSKITITGVSALNSYSWSASNNMAGASGVNYYAAAASGYLWVPYQLGAQVVYQTQDYLTFAASPTSGGTVSPSTGYFAQYENLSISATAAVGYTFSKWTASPSGAVGFANSKVASTKLQVNQPATVTADFKVAKSAVTFLETGLPASTTWSVVFNSLTYSSSTSKLAPPSQPAALYSWTIAPVAGTTGTEWVANPASGSMEVPYQTSQEVVFTEEVQVTLAVSPSGSGTTSPSGSAYYPIGAPFPITATNGSGWVFQKWVTTQANVGLGNTKTPSTNATPKAQGTVTADFVAGTPCSVCSVTFVEMGLPSGAGWGVVFGGANYLTSTGSLTISGLTASASWSADSPVGDPVYGVEYFAVGTASGAWYLGSTSTIEVVYEPYVFVTFQTNPSSGGGTGMTQSTGWFEKGASEPLSAINSLTYKFSSWSTSDVNVTVVATTSASTTFVAIGPGTVTGNFVAPHVTVHLIEYGLPSGSTWAVLLNNQPFYSATTWINITGIPYGSADIDYTTNSYGPPGVEWQPETYKFSITTPYLTIQAQVFHKYVQVTFVASGSGSVSEFPGGGGWYVVGELVVIAAENVTGSTFSGWSDTPGTVTFASTSVAETYVIILGSGTVTGTFT
jgi:Divergent InlB B-repeat domain